MGYPDGMQVPLGVYILASNFTNKANFCAGPIRFVVFGELFTMWY